MRCRVLWFFILSNVSVLFTHNIGAVEVLSAKELALHCKAFPGDVDSIDGQYCIRYIQGFIDGAVATDVRVMLNIEAESDRKSTFSERAIRMRSPSRDDSRRAAGYAEFCLGDPVPLRDVVENVVNDLNAGLKDSSESMTARDMVYDSLRKNYRCEE